MNMIFGRKPVLEALESGSEIERIIISRGLKGDVIDRIKRLSKSSKIKLSEYTPEKFSELSGKNNTQGVIAELSTSKYYSLEELLVSAEGKKYPLFLILDSIQDPQNLGAILRTAECAGVDGVIITTHNSSPVTETAVKTSAGAVSYLKICKAGNLSNTMRELKDCGFWIAGSSLEGAVDYTEPDYKRPLVLVMGNEEKGIRKLTADNCDFLIKIPMSGKIQSLNVSVATGVILFGILNLRKK